MRTQLFTAFAVALLFVLSGCGGGGGGSKASSVSSASSVPSSSSSSSLSSSSVSSSLSSSSSSAVPASAQLSGTAAVGAPIINGQVIAKCQDGSGFLGNVITNSQGVFTGVVGADSLPCALQVSGGSPDIILHSFAFAPGTVNITPLTDLILARTNLQLPAVWFASGDLTTASNLLLLTTIQNLLKATLEDGGFRLPAGTFNPFTTPFSIGDDWDQLLDQIQDAITASSSIDDYEALLTLLKDGSMNAFPSATGGSSSSISSSSSSSSSSMISSSSSSSNGGSGQGNAAVCFNALLAAPGTKIVNHHRTTDTESNIVVNSIYNMEIKSTTTFNGQSVLHSTSTMSTDGTPFAGSSTSYFTVDVDAKRSNTVGTLVETTSPVAITSSTIIHPGILMRFDLATNQSYSQTYTSITTTTTAGASNEVEVVTNVVTTFKGMETITVPAGTYSACRFEVVETGMVGTRWVAANKGMELRFTSGTATTELVSSTVNGVAQ